MKKILFTIIIFMFVAGFALAKEPEYEVTIHVIYNSIPVSKIADLIKSQLHKHKNACKVEVKIKNVDSELMVSDFALGVDLGTSLYDVGTTTTYYDRDSDYYNGDSAND